MTRWLTPILLTAQAGFVVPLWSPCIIDEVSRFRTVQWIKRCGVPATNRDRRRLSEASHRWFHAVSAALQVVEDRPPLEPMWVPNPPDEEDAPIWTAAVRGKVDLVVTQNLRDGPPLNAAGVRTHAGITYIHPDHFLGLLDFWADVMTAGQLPGLEELLAAAREWQREPHTVQLPENIEAYLREIQQRPIGR